MQQEEEYYQFMPKMTTQIKGKNYVVAECENYFKITNKKGFWYELKATNATKKDDIQIFVFDKDLKFVKMKKAEK